MALGYIPKRLGRQTVLLPAWPSDPHTSVSRVAGPSGTATLGVEPGNPELKVGPTPSDPSPSVPLPPPEVELGTPTAIQSGSTYGNKITPTQFAYLNYDSSSISLDGVTGYANDTVYHGSVRLPGDVVEKFSGTSQQWVDFLKSVDPSSQAQRWHFAKAAGDNRGYSYFNGLLRPGPQVVKRPVYPWNSWNK